MELYIPHKPITRDNKGRFVKGNSVCKGVKKHFSKEGKTRIMENLRKAHTVKGRKGTNRRKAVIGINPDGTFTAYPSARFAEETMGICRTTIASRCRGKTKNRFIAGKEWYWESDEQWIKKVKI